MKKIQYILTSVAVLAMAASCALNQLEEPVKALKEGETFILTATAPGTDAGTKTEVSAEGPEILWTPGDRILVFSGENYSNVFTSTNTEPATRAEFQGYLSGFTGSIESQAEHEGFWAVYPYNHTFESIDVKGESITAYVPYAQNLTTGTFDPQALVSVARSHDLSLAFYNVCGGLKFKVAREGIQQVEFKANGGEALAGIVTVKMDALGYPKVEQVEGKSSSVILTAAYGESFKPGTWYYLPCLPATLAQGFTLTFRSTTETGIYRHPAAVEVKRSTWGVLENPEANVTFEAADNAIWYNVIRYTTTDEATITPQNISGFGNNAGIVENTYENGQGIMRFNTAVTEIPYNAFSNKATLKTISLPGTVLEIESNAFSNAASLETVHLNEGLIGIYSQAFNNCKKLTTLEVPSSALYLDNAFRFSSIATFSGPLATEDGVCLISDGLLIGAAPAAEKGDFTIPPGVKAVDDYVFQDDTTLTSLTIPAGVESIGAYSFSACRKMKSVMIEEGVVSIGDYAFAHCTLFDNSGETPVPVNGLETASLPKSIQKLGNSLFMGDELLQAFSGSLIEDPSLLVFDGEIKAVALGDRTEFTVPSSVKVIGPTAFAYLSGLTKVTVSEGVESIGENAFMSCSNLEEVDIQGNVTLETTPFRNCTKLVKFSGPMAGGDGKCLISGGVLLAAAPGVTDFVVPAGVTKIGNNAFMNSPVSSVTFNDGLKEIGEQAFYFCSQLAAINIPGSVTTIGNNAFFFCQKLATITLNEGLQTIGDYAFYLCGNSAVGGIPEIIIPSTVTSIGASALMIPEGILQKVTMLPTTPPTLRGQLFWTAPVIYVPAGSLDAYKNATNWTNYKNHMRIPPIPATIADAIAGADGTNYTVTGVCTSIKNTTYGNWYLQDPNDPTVQIYVYGTITPSGSWGWSSYGIEEGDIVTVEGPKATYKGEAELENVTVISVQKPS